MNVHLVLATYKLAASATVQAVVFAGPFPAYQSTTTGTQGLVNNAVKAT
jgi:hypothetical protein